MNEDIIEQIKENVSQINPEFKNYFIYEYKDFYLAACENYEPILFEKELGLPMFKNFASIPPEDCKDPELIEEVVSDEEEEEYEDE